MQSLLQICRPPSLTVANYGSVLLPIASNIHNDALRTVAKSLKPNIMRYLLLIILTIGIPKLMFSQRIPLINTNEKDTKPIILSDLHISVFVIDNVATTTMEMKFYNENNRVMEGEFNFPLAQGVSVSRFALDINGELREGVVVDKAKAVQAFEAITRRNIDPGIVEVTKGNNFKARVYPIPARGYKKAVVAFEQEINGDPKNYIYKMPLKVENELKSFSVRVEVVMNKPKVLKSDYPSINLQFSHARNSYISDYQDSNVTLDSHLTFAIPKPKETSAVQTYEGTLSSDNYFYTNLSIKAEQRKKKTPKSITLLWDVSTSAKSRDLDKEIKILEGYLKWMDKGTIDLVTFSNRLHKTITYQNVGKEREQLMYDLKSEKYDGGTNLQSIDFSKFETDEVLLFTDGISNFGNKRLSGFKSPILAVNSSNIANHNLLEYLTNNSKGVYINAFNESVNTSINIATHLQKQFIKAEYDTQKIIETFPKTGTMIADSFSFSGKIEGSKATVTLSFGFKNEITESRTFVVDNSNKIRNNLGERIWAQKKLKTLLATNKLSEIKSHGKKFNLVTPSTSLIVLDNVEDYIRYEIIPPASLQDLYFERIALRNQKNNEGRNRRISKLCEDFKADFKWWTNPLKNSKNENGRISAPHSNEIIEIVEDEIEVEETVIQSRELDMEASFSKVSVKKLKKRTPTLKINKWESKAAYINTLKSVDTKDIYAKYLEIKEDNEDNPLFYFDVATYLFQKKQGAEGLRVISNLAELELENTEVLRTLGRKLFEHQYYGEALAVFKEVLEIRPFEPHSHIDIGLTYAEKGEYQKAIESLYTVINNSWDVDIISRFQGIELITLHDINNIIFHSKKTLDYSFIDACLIKNLAVDLRIVIDWDANETDIDLWVKDPTKEICSYNNKNTRLGGRISNDITQGYGPEEFRLKKAIPGTYEITAKFFSSRKQTLLNNVTVRAFIYSNFGTKEEQKRVLTVQLEPQNGGEYLLGEIEFK